MTPGGKAGSDVVYIAELIEAEYARFRDLDPALPGRHAGWARRTVRRMQRLRREGRDPILTPIDLDGFLAWVKGRGGGTFGQDERDRYAVLSAGRQSSA